MAGFYEDLAETADDIMSEFKQGVVTLVRATPGTPDPEEPYIPVTDSTETYSLKATVKSVEDKYVDGTTIHATDSMVTASASMVHTHTDGAPVANVVVNLEIQPGDIVSIDGKPVTIIKEMRVPKAGICLVWKLITRG
ncbi:MAG: hypothetical protein COB78_10870 [Hyphomicrobiales bacterium]|nr:MAG: hypothetical protein COB78_10870 [Hyphomicrobiales bacterium]